LIQKIINIFRIPELRNKLLFTIAMLCIYRIGFYIPLPGVNAKALIASAEQQADSAFAALSNYLSLFSGGTLSQSTIFGLGIMPYISASIILQLLTTVVPSLEKLKKEGEPGMRKINEWTRYLTVGICIIQSFWFITHVGSDETLLYASVKGGAYPLFIIMSVLVLTAGSVFLMWLGEQIDHYGIGNGISLIITAGIVARFPDAITELVKKTSFTMGGSETGQIGPAGLAFVIFSFVFVTAGAILLTQAQRRITIQHAKHMRGRKVYGGQSQYLPLRVNHAGVMPIIFASSLMLFPVMLFRWAENATIPASVIASTLPATTAPVTNTGPWYHQMFGFLANNLNIGQYLYEIVYCGLIFFFSYFWNTVQFQPKEMANQLRDYGSFIKGLRPGKRTADYLENVMNRVTYVGAAFLCVIAVVPTLIGASLGLSYGITQFLGGTGLLITISVMLDLVNRIEANLVMRNYGGFLENTGPSGPGSKIKRNRPVAGDGDAPRGLPT